VNFNQYISEFLSKGGVNKNEKILLHSNIKNLYRILLNEKFKFKIDDIANCFIDFIGPEGTLIIPAFNFKFCIGEKFSIKNTKSEMGVLSETFRNISEKNRTWHPVYSFSLHGKIPYDQLEKKNYSAYGKKSLFNWLLENEGKISILDLPDQNSMTFYHFVEEYHNVNWRFHKNFYGEYEDFDNNISKINASIFVRKINEGIVTDVTNMEKILWEKNLFKGHKHRSYFGLRSIKSRDLFDEVSLVIKNNQAEGKLYKKI